tara:strand:- start:18 stop:251 length:234 start_codon:yes stop_codon:yes gene_type:complete
MKKIKLIWDFRGINGQKTSIHQEKHLVEYFKLENKRLFESGTETVSEIHSFAYTIINIDDLDEIKMRLKPHRAQNVI